MRWAVGVGQMRACRQAGRQPESGDHLSLFEYCAASHGLCHRHTHVHIHTYAHTCAHTHIHRQTSHADVELPLPLRSLTRTESLSGERIHPKLWKPALPTPSPEPLAFPLRVCRLKKPQPHPISFRGKQAPKLLSKVLWVPLEVSE